MEQTLKQPNTNMSLHQALSLQKQEESAAPAKEHYPSAYLTSILPGKKRKRYTAFQQSPSTEDMDNYDMETATAIRTSDMETLQRLHDEGQSFDQCNRSGETLLHLACRRSSIQVVRFLIHTALIKVDVQDDMGRTVLHDICWRSGKANTDLMMTLIQVVSPGILLAEDARGHSCFDFCRKEDWPLWIDFLEGCAPMLKRRAALVESINLTIG